MEELVKQIQQCTKCGLHKKRLNTVPGEGPIDAKIMFIGEAPGEEEDKKGRPFVGRAGKFLEDLLKKAGLQRSDVFITNVVKCRPPNNRYPSKGERIACRGWLEQQINAIQPKIIGALGNHATNVLIGKVGMKKLHGKKYSFGGCAIIPLYHPAAGLYNPSLKAVMVEDMKYLARMCTKIKIKRYLDPRYCESCNELYQPSGTTQRWCERCREKEMKARDRDRKYKKRMQEKDKKGTRKGQETDSSETLDCKIPDSPGISKTPGTKPSSKRVFPKTVGSFFVEYGRKHNISVRLIGRFLELTGARVLCIEDKPRADLALFIDPLLLGIELGDCNVYKYGLPNPYDAVLVLGKDNNVALLYKPDIEKRKMEKLGEIIKWLENEIGVEILAKNFAE